MLLHVTSVKTAERRDKARRTRLRIIEAAHAEFLASGYHGATIGGIARRAGVAVQTVYFVFHTKAELISAVIDTAVVGTGDPTPPQATDWWAAMLRAPTATEALRTFIHGAAPLYARAAGVAEVLRAAALTDEEVRAIWRHHERLHRSGYAQVVEVLASKGPLRRGLTPETATDLLLTFYGDTSYVLLTAERGWTHDAVVDWASKALPLLLLQD